MVNYENGMPTYLKTSVKSILSYSQYQRLMVLEQYYVKDVNGNRVSSEV